MISCHVHCTDRLMKVNGMTSNRTPARYTYNNPGKKMYNAIFFYQRATDTYSILLWRLIRALGYIR